MFNEISFPGHEYETIQAYLNELGYCYTTRVYKEVGKYKVGEIYIAPWGDLLKIEEVKKYWKVTDYLRTSFHLKGNCAVRRVYSEFAKRICKYFAEALFYRPFGMASFRNS